MYLRQRYMYMSAKSNGSLKNPRKSIIVQYKLMDIFQEFHELTLLIKETQRANIQISIYILIQNAQEL